MFPNLRSMALPTRRSAFAVHSISITGARRGARWAALRLSFVTRLSTGHSRRKPNLFFTPPMGDRGGAPETRPERLSDTLSPRPSNGTRSRQTAPRPAPEGSVERRQDTTHPPFKRHSTNVPRRKASRKCTAHMRWCPVRDPDQHDGALGSRSTAQLHAAPLAPVPF